MQMAEYGIHYIPKREKALLAELNDILADVFPGNVFAKFRKTANAVMLKARRPFVYTYFYYTWMKGHGVFLELYPNTDQEGKKKFPNSDAAWILFVNPLDYYYRDESGVLHYGKNPMFSQLVQAILERLSEPWELLYQYADHEERL